MHIIVSYTAKRFIYTAPNRDGIFCSSLVHLIFPPHINADKP